MNPWNLTPAQDAALTTKLFLALGHNELRAHEAHSGERETCQMLPCREARFARRAARLLLGVDNMVKVPGFGLSHRIDTARCTADVGFTYCGTTFALDTATNAHPDRTACHACDTAVNRALAGLTQTGESGQTVTDRTIAANAAQGQRYDTTPQRHSAV